MQTRRLFFVAALTLSALLPLASAPTDHKPAATTHTILIEGFKFVPERMRLPLVTQLCGRTKTLFRTQPLRRKYLTLRAWIPVSPGVTLPNKRELIPTSVLSIQPCKVS